MRLGFAPISWNNEDLPDLRPPTPFERILDEVAAAGYAGTELGDGFPRDPVALRDGLGARGLDLPAAWCGLNLVDPARERDDRRTVEERAALLSRIGGRFLNLAHYGSPERFAWAGRADRAGAPKLGAAEWATLAARCESAARVAADHGLRAVFHPHAGTFVETAAEVEEFAERVDPALVGFCFDVGHAIYGGIDPVDFIRRHGARIEYVHLKDIDLATLARLREERAGWERGLREYVFAELGHGTLDLRGVIGALRGAGYNGWLMVEQDTTRLEPAAAARIARAALREVGL